MKLLHKLLSLIACIAINNSAVAFRGHHFYVVSPSNGSEKFYLELKRLKADQEPSLLREDFICLELINSKTFFSADGKVEMVDPIKEGQTYTEFDPDIKGHNMFKRPYQSVNISVLNQVVEEPVFPCLARKRGTRELRLYLISNEYNFSRWIKRSRPTKCPEKFGRFIFEYSKSKQMANLTAIAEEPAHRLDYEADDLRHYGALTEDLDMISNRSHEICNFTMGRKVRICAVGLSAEEYREGFKFYPQENNVKPECEKKQLTFKYRSRVSKEFSGWVMGCKAEQLGKNDSTTFYMSVGYEPYQFLIYHTNQLVHHFYSHLGLRNAEYRRDK